MLTMLILPGSFSLSSFRAQALLTQLQKIDDTVVYVVGQYLHFVECSESLSDTLSDRLTALLTYGCNDASMLPKALFEETFVVVPRLGTLSPWASKAFDIIQHCGLTPIKRIERGILYRIGFSDANKSLLKNKKYTEMFYDRMTQTILPTPQEAQGLFSTLDAQPLLVIDMMQKGIVALEEANVTLGLALSSDEMTYLYDSFVRLKRNPTDVELMMFAQANSEHCRHKIFNADWIIDGVPQKETLFAMIKRTHELSPRGTVVAYSDNASIMAGAVVNRFYPTQVGDEAVYANHSQLTHTLMKVETHNHPTAIAPFAGAATGAGGEIRDEGATGRGGVPRAGLVGFSVSNLMLPGNIQSWENNQDMLTQTSDISTTYGKPDRIVDALQIMLDGPIGAAAFNNEFGRPVLTGYFRTYQQNIRGEVWGYHKPIMIAGGVGVISDMHTHKKVFPAGTLLIQLGGPGMKIGVGGGAASSMTTGDNNAELDFNSVQRGNPDMQRRAQEVINACWAMGKDNIIVSIHDVGAGGLSNAFPEMVHDAKCGAVFDLRKVPVEESGMAPKEIWSNESQERYVLAIAPEHIDIFRQYCERERCPFSVVGVATNESKLTLVDSWHDNYPVDMPMDVLLGKPPKMQRDVRRVVETFPALDLTGVDVIQIAYQVLRLPTVGDKSFLITIADRTVGGMSVRDQMVGPWQVPVADCAVTALSFDGYLGQAMAMGERTPLAVVNASASGRMAVGEVVTNLAAAPITHLSDIKLSANWMAACGEAGQDAALFDTVQAVALELCPKLGLAIPVGKDSLSMQTRWQDESGSGLDKSVKSPVSLIVSGFAPVFDIRYALTPQLASDVGETVLILVDLGRGKNRLGGSACAQVLQQLGEDVPDLDEPHDIKNFFAAIQQLNHAKKILAYHDRSDGGLFTTLVEMAFASRLGLVIHLDVLAIKWDELDSGEAKNWATQVAARHDEQTIRALFNEELGAVIQVRAEDKSIVMDTLRDFHLGGCSHIIGKPIEGEDIVLMRDAKIVLKESRSTLHQIWSETSWQMARLRDNPACADAEYARIKDQADPGLTPKLTFDLKDNVAAPFIKTGLAPRVAILREQGANSHVETAFVMTKAGFTAVDVHMSDLLEKRVNLTDFDGLIAVGGFSYGDVLGAGEGWAKTILFNEQLLAQFSHFFSRPNTFGLGICNGCQMMSNLKAIIPGAKAWPKFTRNISEQFEARLVMVEVAPSPSIFFQGMVGTCTPIVVSHGEGYANFSVTGNQHEAEVSLHFVDNQGHVTEQYPYNPNGSPHGVTGLTTTDGRFTVMMPHPERVFRSVLHSWHPKEWGEEAPWMQLFYNARRFIG